MANQRSVRLFRIGRSQAVRIPRDLELPGNEALIRKEGDALILVPKRAASLLAVLETLRPLDEEFPAIEESATEEVELGCDRSPPPVSRVS